MKDEVYSFNCVKRIKSEFFEADIINTSTLDLPKFSVEMPDYLSEKYYKFMIKRGYGGQSSNLMKKMETEDGRKDLHRLIEEIKKEPLRI